MIEQVIGTYERNFDNQKKLTREFIEVYGCKDYEKLEFMLVNSKFYKKLFIDDSNELIYNIISDNDMKAVALFYKYAAKPQEYLTTCFFFALNKQQKEIIQFVIDNGLDIKAHSQESFLRLAANGNIEITQLLLKHGAVLETKIDANTRKSSPFYHAIYSGQQDMVKFLLPYMSKVDFNDYYLTLSLSKENDTINNIIKFLLEHEENKNSTVFDKFLSLGTNIFNNIFKRIKKQKSNFNDDGYNIYENLLKNSAEFGNIEMIDYLLLKNVDRNIVTLHGNEKSKTHMININRIQLAEKLDAQCVDHCLSNSVSIKRHKI